MNTFHSAYRESLIVASLIVAGILGAIGCIALVEIYIARTQISSAMSPSRVLGLSAYTVYLVFESYDEGSETVTATMHSPAADQALRTRLNVPGYLVVERQDVILDGTTIVGLTEKERISLKDIAPGTRGSALVRGTEDGVTVLQYLLVGDPFPRP
jgi:hypothetical protein